MTTHPPDGELAGTLAAEATGSRPVSVRRFETGLRHYVFEALFDDRAPVVVRIAADHSRQAMAGASTLSRRLRPLGVPLPRILAEGLDHAFPHLVLERLPGTDLGNVAASLPGPRLDAIAAEVAEAQRITAGTETAGRYGYAVDPADAPRERWSDVLEESLARSRRRIAAAGLFDAGAVDAVAARVAAVRAELDTQPAVPFLHDTTTKNVIVAPDGTFSGIVDVDDLCFGDPRFVPALTLASLACSGGPTHYVDAWMRAAGHRDDGIFRLYVALFLADFMSEHGQVFNGNIQPSYPEDRARLLRIFGESLRRAAA